MVSLLLAGDVLKGDEIHAVPQGGHHQDVRDVVDRREFDLVEEDGKG